MTSTSKETLKLDEIEMSDSNHYRDSPSSKQKGCHLSVAQGFILTFFALVIAVLVGVIVHFAGGGSKTECKCVFPSMPPVSEDQQWGECLALSIRKNICLSAPYCQGVTSPTTPPGVTTSTTAAPSQPLDVRLPLKVVPDHYDVTLRPDIYTGDTETFKFSGDVTIYVTCQQATNVITLQMKKLEIEGDIQLLDTGPSSMSPTVQGWEEDKERQFLKVNLGGMLTVGMQYIVKIKFNGPLKPDLVGLYWSSYKSGTDTRYLATTQMQPTDARKTFPCFDEPGVKATFNVTLQRKSNKKTLANMNLLRTDTLTDGWVADVYAKTVNMSSYLLAFIVCDFSFKEGTTARGTTFRVWSRPEAVDQTTYALQKGIETIEYFESYFNISFPLPKQDMIAVPDFAAGAMENWGLIIYRETALLYDPTLSSAGNKQRVAEVVVHELAHQWFGNLVTPVWWDDLWLNEGFASYMEYVGMDQIEPSWDIRDQFVERDLQRVFLIDSLSTSHPIYVPVNHPDEINEIFDSISYLKGASIIRMMNFFLGESTFTTGLTKYLNMYSYDNSNHTDLWQELGKQAVSDGKTVNVPDVMNTWVRQMGYPVVKVDRSGATATVTQQHFLSDPSKPPTDKYPSPYGYKWEVPFTYTDESGLQWSSPPLTWLRRTQATTSVSVNSGAKWMIGNIGQYGYYRVNYDQDNWDALIQQLQDDHTKIPVKNRAQIIDDAISVGRSGYLNELVGLRTTEYLSNEKHYVPWKSASDALGYYNRMLKFTEYNGAYQSYMLKLAKPGFDELGLDYDQIGETHLNRYRRSLFTSITCAYGYDSCKTQVRDLFKQWMNNPTDDTIIKPDLKSTVYCNGIRYGGTEEWNFLYNKYKTTNVAAEASRILSAITCSREPWILSRLLQYSLDADEIRRQDAVYVIADVSSNPVGKLLAWNFFRAQWDTINEYWGGGFFQISTLISSLTSSFNTEFELQQLQDFRTQNPDLGTGERAYEQAVEATQTNINWLNQNKHTIGQWLTDHM